MRLASEPREKGAAAQTIPKDDGPAQQLHRDGDLSLLNLAGLTGGDHAISTIWALDADMS